MATDLERLVVQLSADIKGYENAMARAQGTTNRTVRNIQNQFSRSNRVLTDQFSSLAKSLGAAFLGGVSLQGAQRLVDTSIRIQNALKVAGLEGTALSAVYDKLFASAQRNAAPLEALVTLYGRAAIVQGELKVSTEELLGFTDNVAAALRVAGTDATTASGALLQLSQALGAGTVRAEEFNSILEGALPIAQAAAAGLDEAGGSVAKLRALVVDGAVSSEAFFRAFEAGSYILEEKLAGAESTVSQAFVRLQNVLIDTAGELNEGTGASDELIDALDRLADAIQNTDFSPLISGALEFAGAVITTIGEIERMARALGDLTGASQFGEFVSGRRAEMNAQGRIDAAFAGTVAEKGDRVGGGEPMRVDVTNANRRRSVSLKDYAAPSSSKGGGGRGRGRGRGGSGSSRPDEFAREVEQIKERTAAIQAETQALASLNPLVNDYGYALEKARAEQELLTAAKKAGKEITPQLRDQIAQLAETYAVATVEAEKLAKQQDQMRDLVDDFNATARDMLGGFIQDLRNGVSATDALKNALNRLADSLLNSGLDALFGGGKGGGGGIFGNLLSGILGGGGFKSTPGGFGKMLGMPGFSSGTGNTGGARGQVRGLVHGQEAVIPLPNGGRIPVAVTGQTKAASSGIADVRVSIDQNGNLQAFVERVSYGQANARVRAYDRNEAPATAVRSVQSYQDRYA